MELAEVLQRLALALEPLGRWEEALALERRSLAILKGSLGPVQPEVATARLRLSQHLLQNEFFTEALAEAREALSIAERVYPAADGHVAAALQGVASALLELSRGREALPLAARALDIVRRDAPPLATEGRGTPPPAAERSDLAAALLVHSAALLQTGQAAAALGQAQRAREIYARTVGVRHVAYAYALMDLGHAHAGAGDQRRALSAYRESLAVLEASQLRDAWSVARPLLYIGQAELLLGDRPAAIVSLSRARDLLERFDPTAIILGDAYFLLAQALGPGPRATALLGRALSIFRAARGGREQQRAAVERLLGGPEKG